MLESAAHSSAAHSQSLNSPLLLAAATGLQEVSDTLLDSGADKDVQNFHDHGVYVPESMELLSYAGESSCGAWVSKDVVGQVWSSKDGRRPVPPSQARDDNVGELWLHVPLGCERDKGRNRKK